MSSRFVVVEDEPRSADFVVRGLAEEGYHAEHAADGRVAWLRLQSDNWDLIVLDWWLPVEDGLQLLKRFRQKNRVTPVLFLRNPQKVLSRTRIYESVWDENFDGMSNTLEVHVKGLRRKLESTERECSRPAEELKTSHRVSATPLSSPSLTVWSVGSHLTSSSSTSTAATNVSSADLSYSPNR